jgi:hypothetical protein
MRVSALASLAVLAIGTMAAAGPVQAQTYDPSHPVCLHVFGPINYYECNYSSLPQCAMSASGRAAECDVNPYFANAYEEPPARRHRRHRHAY